MIEFYRKYGRTIFDVLLIVLTIYVFMYLFAIIFNVAKPVFIALLIYLLIEPFAKFLNRKLRLKKVAATTVSMILLVLILFSIVIVLAILIISQIKIFALNLPKYLDFLQREFTLLVEKYSELLNNISPNLVTNIKEYLVSISGNITGFFESIFFSIVNSFTSISGWVITIVLGIILAFFLSLDIEKWERIANEHTPKTFKNAYVFLKENVIKGITLYLKAQLKLMTITFVLVLIGLLIVGVDGALTIAFFSGLLDLLPILGVSTIFIPWIVYLLIVGEFTKALYLGIILIVVVIIRQILEPRITGESLGVSAFLMLSFMLISLAIFGVAGLILAPILIILIKALIEQGYMKRWIRMPEGEMEYEEKVE